MSTASPATMPRRGDQVASHSLPLHCSRRRQTLLRISPHDIDDYLVTGGPTSQPDTSTRVINALEELRGHVEELAGVHHTPQDALASIIQDVQWQSPEEGTLLASVGLGYENGRGDSLAMILKREESDDDEAGWKFHNLLPLGATPGLWQSDFDTVLGRSSQERGLADGSQGQLPVQTPLLGQHDKEERMKTFNATSQTSAPFAAMSETGHGTAFAAAEAAEDDDGQEKKTQHLYTNAEDFWGGWEGEDEHSGDGGAGAGDANSAAAAVEEDDEEDDYWNSYGAQGAPDDDQQGRGAIAAQGSTDLGATTSVTAAPGPALALADVGQTSGRAATDINTHTHTATNEHPPAPTAHRTRRDGHARGLLRSLVGLVQEGPEPVSEEEFLSWARQAFREDQLERGRVTGAEAVGEEG